MVGLMSVPVFCRRYTSSREKGEADYVSTKKKVLEEMSWCGTGQDASSRLLFSHVCE